MSIYYGNTLNTKDTYIHTLVLTQQGYTKYLIM